MKPPTLLLGFFLLACQPALGQRSVQSIRQQLPLLTKFQALPLGGDHYLLTPMLDTLPVSHFLADLHNRNPLFAGYLFGHYTRIDSHRVASRELRLPPLNPSQQRLFLRDTLASLNSALHHALQNDTLLNRHFVAMTAYYLQAKGITVEGYPLPPKATVSIPALLQTAARFFECIKPGDDQRIAWQLKLGNDRSEVRNHPLVEAFCYQVIWTNSLTPGWHNHRHEPAFLNELTGLQNRLSSLGPEHRTQIRQAMQDLIARNPFLEKQLLQAYDRLEPFLGFVLAR